jgi:hypothetical protein
MAAVDDRFSISNGGPERDYGAAIGRLLERSPAKESGARFVGVGDGLRHCSGMWGVSDGGGSRLGSWLVPSFLCRRIAGRVKSSVAQITKICELPQ